MELGNNILIADDDPIIIAALRNILSGMYTIFVAKDGKNAIKMAMELLPDVILLDVMLPDINGFDVIMWLKQSEKTKDIPIVLLTGLTNSKDEERGLTLGAADYIRKPFDAVTIKPRIQNQMKIVNQLKMIKLMATTDALTGLFNRRQFNLTLESEYKKAMREKFPVGLLMIDADDFKMINDIYGHLVGDVVLQNLARVIRKSLNRPTDMAARWGGEEFAVLLSDTDLEGTVVVAEKIRAGVEQFHHRHDEVLLKRTTVSIGIACYIPNPELPITHFISAADKALYTAKKQGKNTIAASPGGGGRRF